MNKAWIWEKKRVFPEILNPFISRAAAENFPFSFIDVFLTRAGENVCCCRRAERGGHRFRDAEHRGDIYCTNCEYMLTFHYISHLLIICCESPKALLKDSVFLLDLVSLSNSFWSHIPLGMFLLLIMHNQMEDQSYLSITTQSHCRWE